jgi:hypothetical protein
MNVFVFGLLMLGTYPLFLASRTDSDHSRMRPKLRHDGQPTGDIGALQ